MGNQAADELVGRLSALLEQVGRPGQIEHLVRLSGGASRHTWSFDLVEGGERSGCIAQLLRGSSSLSGPGPVGEATMIRAAEMAGVPVPTVLADDDGTVLGVPGIVMQRLEGETIARKLLRDDEWATARDRLVAQSGDALAAIHRLDVTAMPPLRDADQLEEMRKLLAVLDRSLPAFELAIRYLERHRPSSPRHAVVHGDYRLGNLLIGPDGLRGVLDWELAHVGDPVEDLGWYCVRAWRFGSALPAGGMGTREQLLDAYAAAGGGDVDPGALRWWELLGTLKWGLICIVQSEGHLSGMTRSMEHAAIGRRVCENEWDVLGLLPGPELGGVATDPPASDGPDLYGRPTAAELVEAVREWIEGDLRSGTEGRIQFHTRVAANALKVIERQLALGPTHLAEHRAGLASLGCDDDRQLCARIRSGELDDRAEEVRAVVGRSVRSKVEVANPRWLEADL